MHISLVGVNHQTAPITIREKASISSDGISESLQLLHQYAPHAVLLSTCNRTEVYAMDNQPTEEACIDFLMAITDVSFANLLPHIYLHQNETAVEHLFSVASGLDSMIVGEFEILGQVGDALKASEEAGMVNLPLRHIFQSAIRSGRNVREETGISKNALSVSSVAVDLATRVVGALDGTKIMVIGAGEAGELVAKVAKERGAHQIVVANRTYERAATLAETLDGTAIALDNLAEELCSVNVVVTCAGAPQRILDVCHVEEAMDQRSELPLVIIDIAVPRDVEPTVKQIRNVFLYNIDDLTEVSNLNRKQREAEIQDAREITDTEVNKFISWWQAFEVRPVVSSLMEKAEKIRRTQLDRTLKKLPPLSDEERDNLEAMTKSIVTKLLNDPVHLLKSKTNRDWDYAEIVSELFRLDLEKGE